VDEATEALAREFARLHRFAVFEADHRIWWLYLREAVVRWLEKHEDEALRAALQGVKEFPEKLPGEAARWEDLRMAVGILLERFD